MQMRNLHKGKGAMRDTLRIIFAIFMGLLALWLIKQGVNFPLLFFVFYGALSVFDDLADKFFKPKNNSYSKEE